MTDSPARAETSTVGPAPTAAVRRTSRQRRPTGAPPPLPWRPSMSTTAWLVLAAVIVLAAFQVSYWTVWRRPGDHADTWLLRQLAAGRTPWLTDLANAIKVAGTGWGVTVIGLSVALLTIIFRRWRHLLVFAFSLFFLETVGGRIYGGLSRPRPYGVPIIASWG